MIESITLSSKKFGFLDSYRGFLAWTVALDHASNHFKAPEDYQMFSWWGHYTGVMGFFILSSFLLTYKMQHDFDVAKSRQQLILIVLQFMIKRFFRIYIVVFVFCLLNYFVTYNYSCFNVIISIRNFSDLIDILGMEVSGKYGHLWTIPVEIKYYFYIPLICFGFKLAKNRWRILWSITAVFTASAEYFNFMDFSPEHYEGNYWNFLRYRFSIFFAASLMAVIFIKVNV